MFELVGAIHIHSVFSDGSGKVEDIASFAGDAGLDYIVLTDHNTLRALEEGYEGWHGNTLLFVGCEINDKEIKNHYLALGIDKPFSTRLPAKEYVRKVKEAGGIGFLAHPFEERTSMKEHPPYPWTEWDTEDFTGIEIWNHMSEWMEGLTEENKYNRFVHPLKSIIAPNRKALDKWDELNLTRPVVGIGGVDAHAHKMNLLGFFEVEVFPYKVLFKSIRTHVVLDKKISKRNSFENIKKMFYDSLRKGRCFISNYYHGDARGFRFFAEADNKKYKSGDTITGSEKVKLRVLVPDNNSIIKLIHNGKQIDSIVSNDTSFIIREKGVYRVEIFKDDNAWIYSNHIRIF